MMVEVQFSYVEMEKLCLNASNPYNALDMALEWAKKANDYVEDYANPRIAELESLNAALDIKYNAAKASLDQMDVENQRLREALQTIADIDDKQ